MAAADRAVLRRQVHSDAVVLQTSTQHDARPVAALLWWQRNRKLGSIEVVAIGQFWVEHNLEVGIRDDRFLGFGRGEYFIVDGWSTPGRAISRLLLGSG